MTAVRRLARFAHLLPLEVVVVLAGFALLAVDLGIPAWAPPQHDYACLNQHSQGGWNICVPSH